MDTRLFGVRAIAPEFLNSWRQKLQTLMGRPVGAGAPGRKKVKRAKGKARRHGRFHGYREETNYYVLILSPML